MIFQHTLPQVLSGQKTQTSRIWKDNYTSAYDDYENMVSIAIINPEKETYRVMHYIGQILSVQAGRGQKGCAKIQITSLLRRDVRDFYDSDFEREGVTEYEFYRLWLTMHDKKSLSLLDFRDFNSLSEDKYMALVIQFKLVEKE